MDIVCSRLPLRRNIPSLLHAAFAVALSITAASAATVQFTEKTTTVKGHAVTIFTKPTDTGGILRIVSGAGGALWFAEAGPNDVAKFAITGKATIFPLKTANSGAHAIALGPDGNMWVPEFNNDLVARVTKAGAVKEFATTVSPLHANDIHAGSDGDLWFPTDSNGIGRITPAGKSKFFPIVNDATQPTAVTLGTDGNIWFVEWAGNNVGFITPAGKVTEYPAALIGPDGISNSFGIAAGPDGRIWFADPDNARIGAINLDGTGLTYYTTGLTGEPDTITSGPDGNLYFGEFAGVIGRITTKGVVTEYPLPGNPGSNFPVLGICVGPDSDIWFANNAHAQVGRLKIK